MTTVGDNIRRIRESLGLSQYKLALRAGVPPSTIARTEGGGNFRRETLFKIAQGLDVDMGALMEEVSDAQFSKRISENREDLIDELVRIAPGRDPKRRKELLRRFLALDPKDEGTMWEVVDRFYATKQTGQQFGESGSGENRDEQLA